MTRTVGVVGAGVIGRGVAQALGEARHRVILVDVRQEALDDARDEIARNARLYRLLGHRSVDGAADALATIEPTLEYDRLGEADFVIENVVEDPAVKRDVYARLEAVCPPKAVFAANTSVIPVTEIAGFTSRPERVLGLHFMNPVPLKPTVELIRGARTSEEAVHAATELLTSIGKDWVTVSDSPGFVSNRVLMLAVNQAAYLVAEGVAPAEEVDRVFKSCFEHKMGMLETADLIGIDTVVRSIELLHEFLGSGEYAVCPLLRTMVEEGRLGRKSGRGFYDYGGD
jgi:3-hydroxybutyryl-CoA dehydrogenase